MDKHIPRISVEPDPFIYTAEDINNFLVWAFRHWEYNDILKKWMWCMPKEATSKQVTTIELLRIWEESKNE
jgi:hypothetical protein